ncbi:MAG: FxsA family protein [Pirellulaceae bacterium]|nr:FxsA family protein [Pirellulaceae bacterium]
MFYLFLLFILLPLIELFLLVYITLETNLLFAIGLIIVTGVIGAALARWQGAGTLRSIQSDLAAGKVPSSSLVDALLIFFAGGLLLTPGILTDFLGFALLIPWGRFWIKKWLSALFLRHSQGSTTIFTTFSRGPFSASPFQEPSPSERFSPSELMGEVSQETLYESDSSKETFEVDIIESYTVSTNPVENDPTKKE